MCFDSLVSSHPQLVWSKLGCCTLTPHKRIPEYVMRFWIVFCVTLPCHNVDRPLNIRDQSQLHSRSLPTLSCAREFSIFSLCVRVFMYTCSIQFSTNTLLPRLYLVFKKRSPSCHEEVHTCRVNNVNDGSISSAAFQYLAKTPKLHVQALSCASPRT